MWNPFRKNDDDNKPPKMGMVANLAMKRLERMDPKEREKLMKKVLTPENISKNKDKILSAMKAMRASGQLTEEQMREAKKRLNIWD